MHVLQSEELHSGSEHSLLDHQVVVVSNVHLMQTHSKHGIFKPKIPYIGLTHIADCVPKIVHEALQLPLWKQAMAKKFITLQRYPIWTLVPQSPKQHVFDNK